VTQEHLIRQTPCLTTLGVSGFISAEKTCGEEWNETKEIQEEQESFGWQPFSSPVAVLRFERVQKLPYPALATRAVSLNR